MFYVIICIVALHILASHSYKSPTRLYKAEMYKMDSLFLSIIRIFVKELNVKFTSICLGFRENTRRVIEYKHIMYRSAWGGGEIVF